MFVGILKNLYAMVDAYGNTSDSNNDLSWLTQEPSQDKN